MPWQMAAPLRPDEAKDWTCCRALAAEIGIVSLPVSPFFGLELKMDGHIMDISI